MLSLHSIRLPKLEQSVMLEHRLDALTLRRHSFSDIKSLDVELEGYIHDDLGHSHENCARGDVCWRCKRLLDWLVLVAPCQ
jgi:hypothetical protein